MTEAIEAPKAPGSATAATVPHRKRGRPRDDAADDRILTAAADLFLARGYDAMTIDAVAMRARVGKATVYRRWASKEDLAAAAVRRIYGVDVPVPDTGSLHDDLVWAYSGVLSFTGSSAGRNYLRTTIRESVDDPRVAGVHRGAIEALEAKVATIFERAAERGDLDPEASPAWSVQWVVGLVVTAALTGHEQPGPADAERLARMAVRGIGR